MVGSLPCPKNNNHMIHTPQENLGNGFCSGTGSVSLHGFSASHCSHGNCLGIHWSESTTFQREAHVQAWNPITLTITEDEHKRSSRMSCCCYLHAVSTLVCQVRA